MDGASWLMFACLWICAVSAYHRKLHVMTEPKLPAVSLPFELPQTQSGTPDMPLYQLPLVMTVPGASPEQISVTYWGPGEMMINWATSNGVVAPTVSPLDPNDSNSYVKYYTTLADGTSSAPKTTKGLQGVYVMNYKDMGSTALSYASPILHHVILTGLPGNSSLVFQVVDPVLNLISDQYTVPVPAYPGNPGAFPFRFNVLGDLGQTYNSSNTLVAMQASLGDMLLFTGDLCYADLWLSNGFQFTPPNIARFGQYGTTYQPKWDGWARMMQKYAMMPTIYTVGNHDIEPLVLNGSIYTFTSYNARYPSPAQKRNPGGTINLKAVPVAKPPAPQDANNLYFSVDVPGAHIVSLTPYIPNDTFSPDSPQWKWLESDLASVNRTKTPWLIAMFHAPWYNTYVSHYMENECMRQTFEPLLYKYGVDLVLNGHVHAYERSFPVYNFTVDDCGPVHITVGDGGNIEGLAVPFMDSLFNTSQCTGPPPIPYPYAPLVCTPPFVYAANSSGYCFKSQPYWSAFRRPAFGFGTLDLLNATHAEWKWTAANINNVSVMVDKVTLVRSNSASCHARRRRVMSEATPLDVTI